MRNAVLLLASEQIAYRKHLAYVRGQTITHHQAIAVAIIAAVQFVGRRKGRVLIRGACRVMAAIAVDKMHAAARRRILVVQMLSSNANVRLG